MKLGGCSAPFSGGHGGSVLWTGLDRQRRRACHSQTAEFAGRAAPSRTGEGDRRAVDHRVLWIRDSRHLPAVCLWSWWVERARCAIGHGALSGSVLGSVCSGLGGLGIGGDCRRWKRGGCRGLLNGRLIPGGGGGGGGGLRPQKSRPPFSGSINKFHFSPEENFLISWVGGWQASYAELCFARGGGGSGWVSREAAHSKLIFPELSLKFCVKKSFWGGWV